MKPFLLILAYLSLFAFAQANDESLRIRVFDDPETTAPLAEALDANPAMGDQVFQLGSRLKIKFFVSRLDLREFAGFTLRLKPATCGDTQPEMATDQEFVTFSGRRGSSAAALFDAMIGDNVKDRAIGRFGPWYRTHQQKGLKIECKRTLDQFFHRCWITTGL